ncbi:MAG: hypothetical protein JO199_06435 [Candidatus Eremiobacteraeota bacterium]|nr:hypothetical protein [Candidatus Eremiobacteraeota bacterium]
MLVRSMQGHELLKAALPYCIPIAILGIAIRVTWRDMRLALAEWRGILLACAVCFVLDPLIAAAVCKGLQPNRFVEGAVLFAAIAPGDPFVVLEAEHRKGNVPLSIVFSCLLALLMPLSLFVWMPIMVHWFGGPADRVSAAGAFFDLVKLVFPFVVGGVALRSLVPKFAEAIEGPVKILAQVAYIFIGGLVVFVGIKFILTYSLMTALAVFIVASLSLIAGYRISAFSTERSRRTGALAVALGNFVVVIYIGTEAYKLPSQEFCAALAVAVVVRILAIFFWNRVARRSAARAEAEPVPAA